MLEVDLSSSSDSDFVVTVIAEHCIVEYLRNERAVQGCLKLSCRGQEVRFFFGFVAI